MDLKMTESLVQDIDSYVRKLKSGELDSREVAFTKRNIRESCEMIIEIVDGKFPTHFGTVCETCGENGKLGAECHFCGELIQEGRKE